MNKDVKDTINQAADTVKDAVNKGADVAKDAADATNEHFEDFAGIAEDEFSRLYGEEGKLETLVNFMRDRPILSVGIAAVGSVVLLKLLKCIFCRRK